MGRSFLLQGQEFLSRPITYFNITSLRIYMNLEKKGEINKA
jgi:hypothetical protein